MALDAQTLEAQTSQCIGMREGKDLILATKQYAKEDRAKSWFHTISTGLLLLAAFAGGYYPWNMLLRILFSIIAGLLLVRMFIIYHDYLHHTILKDSWIAKVIFTLFGLYTLNPPSIWKRSHDYHHNHNSKLFSSSIGSFPIVTKEKFLSLTSQERITYLFIRHPLTIAAGYIFAFAWGMCILSLIRNPSKHWDSALALLFHYGIGITALVTFGWQTFLIAFLVPSVISSGLGSYLFYAQHNFPSVTFANQDGWTYIGAALQSSSYMRMNPLMQWFTANIGFHHIHHTNARIPFYRLKDVYDEMPEFQQAKPTSLNLMEIWRCLRLKVWDPELNRMISYREIYS